MRYEHTQRGPLHLMLIGVGIVMFTSAWLVPIPTARIALQAAGCLVLLIAACFGYLTVRDETQHLQIEYGPVPLFRRSVPYPQIEAVERGWSTFLDGWGIHYVRGRGWTWNLWGFDCVVLHLSGGRMMRVGTDDPDGLTAFLSDRITAYKLQPASRRLQPLTLTSP